MRIYLLGFMGSGKSTLGAEIARNFRVPFYDTDAMVEERTGLTIPEIFATHGEDFFREAESRVLRETDFESKAIVATGGGLPVFYHNMQWLLENGVTMYLQWPDELLLDILIRDRSSRPLLAGLDEFSALLRARELYEQRKPFYLQSSMTLSFVGDKMKDYKLLERACKYIW